MQFTQFTAARADTGAVLPYATATAYLAGTATKAALFDKTGASIGNPITSTSAGLIGFAAADALYDVQVVSADSSYSAPLIQSMQLVDLLGISAGVSAALLLVTRPPVPVAAGANTWMFGDSMTAGQGASVPARSYAEGLCAATGTIIQNYGRSGKGSWRATQEAFVALVSASRRDLITLMIGHNDVYRGGMAAKTIAKIAGEHRAFVAHALGTGFVAANSSAVTSTGTWTSGLSASIAVKAQSIGGDGVYSYAVGSTKTFTFTGDAFVLGCFATDGVAQRTGTFTVAIDGATSGPRFVTYSGDGQTDGISDGAYDNTITHDAVVIAGCGSGTHTAVVTITDTASGTRAVYLDYFATLQPRNNSRSLIVYMPPRPAAAGYAFGGGIWSPAAFTAADAAIKGAVAGFYGWPAWLAQTAKWFNPDGTPAQTGADSEHPTDLGHGYLALAGLEGIATYALPYSAGVRATNAVDQVIANGTTAALVWNAEGYDDNNIHDIATNPERFYAPGKGYITFTATILWGVNGTGVREIDLFKNGSVVRTVMLVAAVAGQQTVFSFAFDTPCAVGDYFDLRATQNSGASVSVLAASSLTVSFSR